MTKTVLITGSSSGFGRLTAKLFYEKGWNVIATMRPPEKEMELNQLDNVLVSRLDVKNEESIQKSIAEGFEKFGGIDVLVNNAGYGGYGLFEQVSDEDIRAMYDTNVFGAMNVMRAILPHMRKQRSGTIINVTSIAGLMAAPHVSAYSSTKFALESLSEGMAQELKPLNIHVKTVAPGGFETNFTTAADDNADIGDEDLVSYSQKIVQYIETVRQNMRQQGGTTANPQDVADKIFECATTETPIHNVVGADAEMIAQMKNSLPQQEFLDRMAAMLLSQLN
ncbi:MAG: SDR family oxidoreductase [Chloroflexota bacterium]